MTSSRLIATRELTGWIERVLVRLGAPAERAAVIADSLVTANLRGIDSHGAHLLPYYAEHLRRGNIDPQADGHVVSESGACLLYEGDRGFGQVVSSICCDHAVRLAREHGLGMVVARNSNHFGTAGYWGERISRAGMIGITMTNASPSVPPWQGREGRIGTNPICISVPSSGEGQWMLDMATTTVAKNKILRAARNHEESIPAGWALDAEGVPTTKTSEAELVMPLGGYKGSGLGLWVEILCGVLGGGAMATEIGGTFLFDGPMRTSHTFLAIDVSRFTSPDQFQARMGRLIALIKSTPVAAGYDEVLVAGEPERRQVAARLAECIPIDNGTWERFEKLAQELDLGLPAARDAGGQGDGGDFSKSG